MVPRLSHYKSQAPGGKPLPLQGKGPRGQAGPEVSGGGKVRTWTEEI